MEVINKLIQIGYSFFVEGETITYKYCGSNKPNPEEVKPLLREASKINNADAIQYIKSLIVIDIPGEEGFELKVQDYLELAYQQGIRWLRLCVYKQSKLIVLTGCRKIEEKPGKEYCQEISSICEDARGGLRN